MFGYDHEVVRVGCTEGLDRIRKEFDALGIVRGLLRFGMWGFLGWKILGLRGGACGGVNDFPLETGGI